MDVATIADRQQCSKCQGNKRTICFMCDGTKESKHIGVDACELCDPDGKNDCNACGAIGFETPNSFDQVIAWYAKGHRDFPNAKLDSPEKRFWSEIHLSGIRMRDASLSGHHLHKINFSGSDFSRMDFKEADISDCQFVGANLNYAKAAGATLRKTNFTNANLEGADLAKADLNQSVFEGANIELAKLGNANLAKADLTGANLSHADLSGATCPHTKLMDAKLDGATLVGTDLLQSDLTGAKLQDATLERADLRGVKGLQLDSNYIAGARFSPGAGDLWSTLRRNYTGPMFAFHFFILICFLTPYVLRTVYWTFVNRVQTIATETAKQISDKLETSSATAGGLRVPDQADIVLSAVKHFSPCFSSECQSMPIWHLLLGLDSGILAFFPIALIVYNVFRGILTWKVSLLRAEEERSGYSPAFASYRWLFSLHRAFLVLLIFAIASMLWHLWEWHQLTVWLPESTTNAWGLPTWLLRLVGA